jgi:hypothetical protein
LAHAGMAISVIDAEEAEQTLKDLEHIERIWSEIYWRIQRCGESEIAHWDN